jgi:hypothetical protein
MRAFVSTIHLILCDPALPAFEFTLRVAINSLSVTDSCHDGNPQGEFKGW